MAGRDLLHKLRLASHHHSSYRMFTFFYYLPEKEKLAAAAAAAAYLPDKMALRWTVHKLPEDARRGERNLPRCALSNKGTNQNSVHRLVLCMC